MKRFEEAVLEFFKEMGDSKKMVLSTSYQDSVTSRMMSIVIIDGCLYFQTDKTFRKYKQITGNPNVSLCIDNIQMEGICSEIGHPLEHKLFCEVYKKEYRQSFERYSSIEDERLFVIHPTYIRKWIYEDAKPYVETFDFNSSIYNKNHYETRIINADVVSV